MPSITLGKDVSITGVGNARSFTVSNSANSIDVTAFGDTQRRFRKSMIEQTIEVECVDGPGVDAGDEFTITGTGTGDAKYICTSVKQDDPIDGIKTWTVSGSRSIQ